MWTFSSPEIVFGEDALSRLETIQGRRALIVTDSTMVTLGFVAQVTERLQTAGIETTLFAEVEPDPSLQTAPRGRDQAQAYAPDWVIGLGGGSSLDAAKAIWFLYERPDVDVAAINPFEQFAPASKARFIAIPTTSGTGADVSMGIVLTDEAEARKLTLIARELQPTLAIVDPSLVMALPPQLTADTGMDALTHAIEAYTTPWQNPFTDGLALQAMELIFRYLARAHADGSDAEARAGMHTAASLAGLAFSNAALALAHPLAHALGGSFHTPHGRTVGLFLPYTIQFAAVEGGPRYAAIARFLGWPAVDEAAGTAALVQQVQQLLAQLGQPTTLRDLGIDRDALAEAMPILRVNAASDPQILTTPRIPDEAEIERLFWYAYEGKAIDF